jgi:hypothetical protein
MKRRKMVIRIVALFMALLMVMGVVALALQIVAYSADATTLAAVAATGSELNETRWPIYAAVGAVLVIIVCVVVPIITKKK